MKDIPMSLPTPPPPQPPSFPLCAALASSCLLLSVSLATAGAAEPQAASEFVFEFAPFEQCHASTIAETPAGLVAAWFGGTREGRKDVGIWVARHVDGQWTAPLEAANGVQHATVDGGEHRHPCWNPVLYQAPSGPLLLFYKCGPSPSQWWGMLTTSQDHGQSWSLPRRLPEHIDGPVKNKPVRLPSGTLLCGSSTEYDGWRVHFEMTSDGGRSWTRTGPINDGRQISAIQPSILIHGDQRLQALGRTRQKRIWQAWSEDGGRTWGEMTLTDLPNPNAGTDAASLRDGRHVLVYNHTERGRSPLNVALTKDGRQWQAAVVLEDEPGEYSYPAVIQTADGLVHITYTWRRRRIRHVALDLAQLTLRPIEDGQWPK